MRYGTFTTFDVPYIIGDEAKSLEYREKAEAYLKKEFGKIGGRVRLMMNPHDFGPYPSFEIDFPEEIEEIKDNEFDLEDSENPEDIAKLEKLENWLEEARRIEVEYGDKFAEAL